MATKHLTLFVLLSACTLSLCAKPSYKKCDSSATTGSVTNIDISSDVDKNGVIQLKRGSNVTVSFMFKMIGGSADGITAVVHGVIAGVPIPFKLGNANACKGCGLTCPISAPNSYDYKAIIPVLSEYPHLRLVVKWELTDKNKKDLWCVEMPAVIV